MDDEQREIERLKEENKRLKAQLESKKHNDEVDQLLRARDDLLRLDVVGEYEHKNDGFTHKYVFLDNGIYELYIDGKKDEEYKWTISNGEIQNGDTPHSGFIRVYRINKDQSITQIAYIGDGKREDLPKDKQITWKKIK